LPLWGWAQTWGEIRCCGEGAAGPAYWLRGAELAPAVGWETTAAVSPPAATAYHV